MKDSGNESPVSSVSRHDSALTCCILSTLVSYLSSHISVYLSLYLSFNLSFEFCFPNIVIRLIWPKYFVSLTFISVRGTRCTCSCPNTLTLVFLLFHDAWPFLLHSSDFLLTFQKVINGYFKKPMCLQYSMLRIAENTYFYFFRYDFS